MRLLDGQALRHAVRRARAREYDPVHLVIAHGLKQRHGSAQIIAIVLSRISHRLPDVGEGGEMHHRLGPVFAQYLVEADFVEIVAGNRRVAGRCERLARVGPDIAGAARNQYMSRHRYVLTLTPKIIIPKVRDLSPQAFVQRESTRSFAAGLRSAQLRVPTGAFAWPMKCPAAAARGRRSAAV